MRTAETHNVIISHRQVMHRVFHAPQRRCVMDFLPKDVSEAARAECAGGSEFFALTCGASRDEVELSSRV